MATGLKLLGNIRTLPDGPEEPILYAVTGLPSEDMCIVGYAGRGFDGKRKWYLHWYRNAQRISSPDVVYDSPDEALKAMEDLQDTSVS
jgi:hypothetical protein